MKHHLNKVNVIDFFSGCGGTSVGLKSAGMDIVAGIDNDKYSSETFRKNFPEAEFFERDISALEIDEIKSVLPPGPSLFAGCAPCQPFSRQNQNRSKIDPRRKLLKEFERFVIELLPDFVVVENVPGAQNLKGAGPFDSFMRNLRKNGYGVTSGILRAGDFGVAQERKRFVILAARGVTPKLPEAIVDKPFTVRDAIWHLPPLEAGEIDPIDPDHASMKLSAKNLTRIQATPEGGSRKDWIDKDLVLDCHRGHNGHTDVYGRMRWDSVASGLTTKCLSYSNGRFGHPEQDRAISVREAALIQSFPPDFRFAGPLIARGRQVGNAVPPKMAEAIGRALTGSQSSLT